MKLTKLKGNSYYIDAFTNIGVYVNNGITTIIDCGLDNDSAMQIDETLQDNGLKVDNIIITHAHADHIGGAKYFQDKYNTPVYSTMADTAIANISIMNTSLIYGGMPTSTAKGKMLYANSCNATLLTEENLPDGLQVVDLKGHSISMIGIITSDNVLYCADSFISEKTINKFPLTYILDIEQYFMSLDKILQLNADYIVPSHSEVVTNATNIINLNKQAVLKNISDIYSVLLCPLEVSDIVYNYCKKFNYTLKTSQFFVATTTVKNYLAYLEKTNKIISYVKNNRLYFEKATTI